MNYVKYPQSSTFALIMVKILEDCTNGCIEHKQLLTKETDQIVSDYKRSFRFETGRSITKSQTINRILLEWKKISHDRSPK